MFARGFKSWCENVALRQRRNLGLSPIDPLDAWALAKHLGIVVWKVEEVPGIDPQCLRILLREDPNSWSAATLRVGDRHAIIMNSAHSKGRQASDLTHEQAHILLDHTPARVDISEDGLLMLNTYNRDQEDEAAWLSGCLLLPREALFQIRQQNLGTPAAANKYGVSPKMLEFRLKITGVDVQLARSQRWQRPSRRLKSSGVRTVRDG